MEARMGKFFRTCNARSWGWNLKAMSVVIGVLLPWPFNYHRPGSSLVLFRVQAMGQDIDGGAWRRSLDENGKELFILQLAARVHVSRAVQVILSMKSL